MLTDRKTLEDAIKYCINQYRPYKEIIVEMEEELFNKNIKFGMKLLTGNLPLETQPIEVLYLLSKYFYKHVKDGLINPTKFFTPVEVYDLDNFEFKAEEESNEVIFKNFMQMDEDKWIGYLDVKEIAKLWQRGIATYNKETQRNTIWTKFQGSIIEEINLNTTSVNEIADELLEGKYLPISPIVFNILRNGEEDFEFLDGNLRYHEGQFNCTDGFHRSMGILNALLKKPYLKLNFPVVITNFDVAKARKMIGQEQKKNDLPEKYTKALEDTHVNAVVRELNARKGEMQGKIGNDATSIVYGMAYTTHNTLMMAIEENFTMESSRDVRKVAEYLIKGFNEILGIFIDEFNDVERSQLNNIATYPLTFIGYTALLSELYGKENWIEKLECTLESLNINKFNEEWHEIGTFTDIEKLNKRRVQSISKHFKNLIK